MFAPNLGEIIQFDEHIFQIGWFNHQLLLMEEILHQLIGSLSHYLQGFIHPRWCRISAINSSKATTSPFGLIFVDHYFEA